MNKLNIETAWKDCKKGLLFVAKYYLWLVVILFAFDVISKQVMQSVLKTAGTSIVVIPSFFSFTLVYNNGAGWGMFAGMDVLLISCSLICGLALIFVFIYKAPKISKLLRISLALMITGAFGNLIDRAFFPKGVIDFLEFTFINFPVFNLADSYLVIGIILLIIWYITLEVNDYRKKKAVKANSETDYDLTVAAQKMKDSTSVSEEKDGTA